jgi:hypothetical protein
VQREHAAEKSATWIGEKTSTLWESDDNGNRTVAILTRGADFGKGQPGSASQRDYPGATISRVCGARGVTSGPASPQCMFTSLRTPNSPGR